MTSDEISFAYTHLSLATDSSEAIRFDEIQVIAYCNAALQQFLGLTGLAIRMEIVKADGTNFWVRVPRGDGNKFNAAITAYRGTKVDETMCLLRVAETSNTAPVGAKEDST